MTGDDLEYALLTRQLARQRWRAYGLAFAVFLGSMLVGIVSEARAQAIPTGRPLILWAPLPVIGMYTIDSARVDDSLPEIATADWPAFTDSVVAHLHTCTRLRGGLAGWQVRTVASSAFSVSTWNPDKHVWHADDAYVGFTFPHVRRIYVVQQGLYSPRLIEHELLHALLADHGFDPRHGTPVADGMFKRCHLGIPQ